MCSVLCGAYSEMSEPQEIDLFLDTSAQFSRHSLDPQTRSRIEALLGSARITGSSTYSRLEFKLSFLRDLAYLHGKLRQFRSIPEVFVHLAKLPPPHDRKLRRTLNHLARFWQTVPGGDEAIIDAILLSIEENVLSYWDWFDESVDHLADGTGCVRSTEPPRLHRGHVDVTLNSCRPARIRCRIHKFFEENRQVFQGIVAVIEQLPEAERSKELKSVQRLTAEASNDPRVLCDDRVCRRIGDALIGVDGKGFPAIVSSNATEFAVICRALGNNLIQIPPS